MCVCVYERVCVGGGGGGGELEGAGSLLIIIIPRNLGLGTVAR